MPPGCAERRFLDEVADRVDAAVAGGVELVDVVADAALDCQARLTFTARFAVDRLLTVEHLGEDARRRGLARATRSGEQVRLAFAPTRDRVAKRANDMVLPLELAEATWPVAAVQRLGGHCGRAYPGGVAALGPALATLRNGDGKLVDPPLATVVGGEGSNRCSVAAPARLCCSDRSRARRRAPRRRGKRLPRTR